MTRKTKWYNSKWFYIIIFAIIIGGIYFGATRSITYINYLKSDIEALTKEKATLDSLYNTEKVKKEKIRIIKEKIDITEDIKKLQTLIDEYDRIKKDTTPSTKPTPKELLDYLNKEF